LLYFTDGTPFAIGKVQFGYRPASRTDAESRIHIPIRLGDNQTSAVLDTASPFVVLPPGIAKHSRFEEHCGQIKLLIRGDSPSGNLYRMPVTFLADEGDNLTVSATVFVPILSDDELWDLPAFIGLSGCLERMRFAVDVLSETFYFGPATVEDLGEGSPR